MIRMTWYNLALFSLFAYGIQNFLYKVAAEKKCNTAWVMVAMMTTITVLGAVFFIVSGAQITNLSLLLFLSFTGGPLFLASLAARTEALKNASTSVVYPITRFSVILVVLFSIVYFREHLSMYQIAGIGLAVIVFVLLTRHNHEERARHADFRAGVILAVIALVTGAGATIISKFAAESFEEFFSFIAISNAINIFLALGIKNKLQRERENPKHTNAIIIGVLSGLFNFVGYYAIMHALAAGPLSIIAAVHSMNFVIAILLAVLIYKEELTKTRLAGIGLTVLALILLRLS